MSDDSSKTTAAAEPLLPEEPERSSEPVAKKLVPWGLWTAIIYTLFIFFAAQLAASLVVLLYPKLKGWDSARATDWLNNSVPAQFWYVLLAETITVASIWWYLRYRKVSLRIIGWRSLRLKDPLLATMGLLSYYVLFLFSYGVVSHFFHGLNTSQKQELGFDHVSGTLNLLLTFVSLVVLPPLAEETVFRGFLFTGLRRRLKPVGAALITSALFATAHLQFGTGKPLLWVAALDTFTLSLVLCYLRHKTDSLWPGILVHALKNSVAFISLFLLHP